MPVAGIPHPQPAVLHGRHDAVPHPAAVTTDRSLPEPPAAAPGGAIHHGER
jgi:hypothetical protein